MRVLLVHNYYGSSAPSGENQVFEAERAMLQRHGVTVDVFTRHSDEIRGTKVREECEGGQWTCRFLSRAQKLYGLIKGAACTVANPFAARALKKKIREFGPDVVHFHNTFPLISPLAIRAAIKQAPVVMTLHNYRTVCAAGVPMRGNRVCDACFSLVKVIGEGERRGLTVIPALRNRCYRGSFLATLPLALNIWLYRKSWAKWVSRFICLTPFAKEMMTSAGFPQEQVVVKGNFVGNFAGKTRMAGFAEKQGYIFVGRLSDEKGVKTLLDAWRLVVDAVKMNGNRSLGRLLIIGDGDQRAEYEKLATGLPVQFLGQKSHDEVLDAIARSRAVIIPSICIEGLPTALMEAFTLQTPVIASDLGALPSLVGCRGEVFKAGDPHSLSDAIVRMSMRPDYDELCQRCLKEASERYCEEGNCERLVQIYQEVISEYGR